MRDLTEVRAVMAPRFALTWKTSAFSRGRQNSQDSQYKIEFMQENSSLFAVRARRRACLRVERNALTVPTAVTSPAIPGLSRHFRASRQPRTVTDNHDGL